MTEIERDARRLLDTDEPLTVSHWITAFTISQSLREELAEAFATRRGERNRIVAWLRSKQRECLNKTMNPALAKHHSGWSAQANAYFAAANAIERGDHLAVRQAITGAEG